ncbi:MAG: fructosamine kinase family protein [Bacteroidota bacterium]
MSLPVTLQQSVADYFQGVIRAATPVEGGCIHRGQRIAFEDGRVFFLKFNQQEFRDHFQAELAGLTLLKESAALRVPREVHLSPLDAEIPWLAMEWVEPGARQNTFWSLLGQGLAQLHRHTREGFGLDLDNYIGSLPQSNRTHATWADFWVEERIEPQVKIARDHRYLERNALGSFERLFHRAESLFPTEPPALIHGDLWGGNLLTDLSGSPVLIDPATYFGHREMEIAFMGLFDQIPASFFEAYQTDYPLESGWRNRQDLCNLYPLMVHLNLFGASYRASVMRTLHAYL